MAKKPTEEVIVNKTEEVIVNKTEEVIEDTKETVQSMTLSNNWEEKLVAMLAKVDGSHIEKNAIKAIINGLIS